MSADGGRRRITDRLFYWIAGACGLATGVVGAAFHLAVDHLLRWPDWLAGRLGTGPLTVAVGRTRGVDLSLYHDVAEIFFA